MTHRIHNGVPPAARFVDGWLSLVAAAYQFCSENRESSI
jgi:hypothetical protein